MNREKINIMLSPVIRKKLEEMHKNAVKLYGREISRSMIIEALIERSGDRMDAVKAEIRKTQLRLTQLSDELVALQEAREEK
jgi:hypothetical protein